MPDDSVMVSISSQTGLHPDEISRRTFPSARRGVDPEAVRKYLETVAAELQEVLDREQSLRRRLAEAERRAAEPELDEQTLLRALGAETARILQTAHDAAAEVVAKAEARAAEILGQAEGVLAERGAEAESEASVLLEAARAEALALTDTATFDAASVRDNAFAEAREVTESARSEAIALLEATRSECRRIVREARELRAGILGDLAEKRRGLRVQLEQLRTGRDSLVTVVDAVGVAVDELRDRLANAEHEARVAAAEAGEAAEAEQDDSDLAELAEDDIAVELGEGEEAGELAQEEMGSTGVAVAAEEALAEAPVEREAPGGPGGVRILEREELDLLVDEGLAGELGGTELYDAESLLSDEPAAQPSHRSVDELFAKIRANRGDAGETEPVDEAPSAPPPEPAVEAVAEPGEPAATDEPEQAPEAEPEPEDPAQAALAEDEAALAEEDDGGLEPGEGDKELLARRSEQLDPVTSRLARALKRALQNDQNLLLDALRHASGHPDLAVLLPVDEQRLRIEEAAAPALGEAWIAGHAWLGDGAPPADDGTAAGHRFAGQLADEVTGLLRHRLSEALSSAGDVGDGSVDVAGSAYREWRGKRVESAAGDFAVRAFSEGAVMAGNGSIVRWVVDDDGQPCPDCDDNALAGPLPAGEEFPTGQVHPPVHPGCRCLLAPVNS